MFHAFETDHFIGEGLQRGGCSFQQDHFQAVVMVDVNMGGGDDGIVMVVLKMSQLVLKVMLMMIVDDSE